MLVRHILGLLKCGSVTGVVWSFAQMLLIITSVESGFVSIDQLGPIDGEWLFALDILAGIWAIGIYTLARSYFQSVSGAVAVTAIAWWAIQGIISTKFGASDFSVIQAAATSLGSLAGTGVSLLAGVWAYEKLNHYKPVHRAIEA